LVARLVRDQEAMGSNPVTSTNKKGTFVYQKFLFLLSKPQAWHIIAERSDADLYQDKHTLWCHFVFLFIKRLAKKNFCDIMIMGAFWYNAHAIMVIGE
jgi:hypothetical protein